MSGTIEQTIQQFLIETTGDSSLKPDTDLLAASILDSLTMMDLVVFIEAEFEQRIGLDDLQPERFRSIRAISELVTGLKNGRQQRAA